MIALSIQTRRTWRKSYYEKKYWIYSWYVYGENFRRNFISMPGRAYELFGSSLVYRKR